MEMETATLDVIFMRRRHELARKELGKTGLNPLIRSVIVYKGRIIGEGYHREYGGAHAEVNAIQAVKEKHLLPFSTLYVNLEPCSHFGKTPPCSLLIKENKIPKIVIGTKDPNPLVAGKGLKILEKAGAEIVLGVLEEESIFLNRRFFTNIIQKRPYVILKWAESEDGFIDKIRKPGSPVGPNWISNVCSRKLVHKWRGEESGIFAGVNTIINDNPSLNLRDWSGKQAIRISIDRHNRIDDHYKIKDGKQETILFTQKAFQDKVIQYEEMGPDFNLEKMLAVLFAKNIGSLIIEGGAQIFKSIIESGLWDEARVFKGNVKFENGIKAPAIPIPTTEEFMFGDNLLLIYYNTTC